MVIKILCIFRKNSLIHKTMNRKLLCIFAIVLCVGINNAFSQYETAGGVRLGIYNGITLKHFLNETAAVEGIAYTHFRYRGFGLTGLYEVHMDLGQLEGFKLFYGGGAHIGTWDGSFTPWTNTGGNYFALGVDGILGVEYTPEEFPVTFSADWKPAFDIIGYNRLWTDGGALSIRYIF